jgi:ribosomal protein S18 acetylase RimI-like enzyme
MEKLSITKGNPDSETGAKLNCMALDYMAYPLVGTKNSTIIEETLKKLWKLSSNRFSHEYAYEIKAEQKTLGMITCFPVSILDYLSWRTFVQIVKLRKWRLIKHTIINFKEVISLVSLKEGRTGEYHISTLATLPESRGYGIGSRLMQFAEQQALNFHLDRCSLTVKKENKTAIGLYEKLGYKIVGSIEKFPYSMHRMVKILQPSM